MGFLLSPMGSYGFLGTDYTASDLTTYSCCIQDQDGLDGLDLLLSPPHIPFVAISRF